MQLEPGLLFLFLLPPYVANATPVIFGGGMPIDLGRKWIDGRRILGNGKTYRGLIIGVASGIIVSLIEYFGMMNAQLLYIGVLSSIGAMFGDMGGSFVKRRMAIEQGRPSIIMDQLLFIIFALIFSYPLLIDAFPFLLSIESIAVILILTYVLHRLMNIIANLLGLKKVPW